MQDLKSSVSGEITLQDLEIIMRIYLVQHGDALPKDVDPDRNLSEKGNRDSAALGEWLKSSGVSVNAILHSGKTRARKTAELLLPALAIGGEVRQDGNLGPNDPPEALLGRLRDVEDDMLVASHMPFVSRVVSVALTGEPDRRLVEFEPGSVAGLYRTDENSWRLFLFARPEHF
jgi:phosphohistidine phosphatase